MSIHVVDVSRGVVAHGMRVAVYRHTGDAAGELLAQGVIGADGSLRAPVLVSEAIGAGRYEVHFDVAGYYREQSVALPREPFLDIVRYAFGITDPAQHYHLPMKVTPWGYSCFRGGA
jgi:5-hydroxyisourate hydrolase